MVFFFFLYSVGLAYANIELKNEVQNLSLRVTESKNFEIKFYLIKFLFS